MRFKPVRHYTSRKNPNPRTCMKCGKDVSGKEAEHGICSVRRYHGVRRSEKIIAFSLCPSCAEDLGAYVAKWLRTEVSA